MENLTYDKLLDLNGKTAIVTGALGIGFGISYRLAEAGAYIIIASLNEQEAIDSAQKLNSEGFKALGVRCDVTNEEEVKNMVLKAVSNFSGIDILVNNAGIYPNLSITKMNLADFEKVIDVNLKGVFLCTKYVSDCMIKQGKGGKIINITSVDALHPSNVGLAHYDASKHGVWGFTKNAALELSKYRIWVNAIAPGGIMTEGVKKSFQGMQNVSDEYLEKIPMKRMGEPDDIGKVALFLASDMSSYMTGSQIVVDGGVLLS